MAEKKKIPCRVCGKLFEPCLYCQTHSDVFRWRNFACSRGCAAKYIDDAIAYRESLKIKKEKSNFLDKSINYAEHPVKKERKSNKKISVNLIEDEINIENKETD